MTEKMNPPPLPKMKFDLPAKRWTDYRCRVCSPVKGGPGYQMVVVQDLPSGSSTLECPRCGESVSLHTAMIPAWKEDPWLL